MNVRELIKQLEKMDGNMDVMYEGSERYHNIDEIYIKRFPLNKR